VKVLVIDDDPQVIRDISFCLKVRYQDAMIVSVGQGLEGIEMVETEAPDLVMVDSSPPDIDIMKLISCIREFSDVPLVVLSEEQSETQRASTLETGADEYVTKPLSPIDLLARVAALLRRAYALGFSAERSLNIQGKLVVNFSTHEVLLRGQHVRLTPIEFKLLSELARHENKVVSHRSLLEKVWGPEYVGDSDLIKKHIYRLRLKLHPDSSAPQLIFSERGTGYRFVRPG
jgi:two-component system KDP operon response regulator KdpE